MNSDDSLTNKIMVMLLAQFQKDKEFFLEKLNRDNFKIAVLESLSINNDKGKNLYSIVYGKFLKRKKLDKYKYSNPRFRRNLSSSEFKNVKITAKPSGITEEAKSPVDQIKEEIKQDHPQLDSSGKQEIDSELEHFEQASHLIPVESVSIFWDGVWQLMKLKWSMIAPLTPQERDSLGKMWQPFFEKYTSEKFIILGIPTIMTFGIFAGKIREGMRLKKERKLREEKKEVSE